jgi:hypothetical protein
MNIAQRISAIQGYLLYEDIDFKKDFKTYTEESKATPGLFDSFSFRTNNLDNLYRIFQTG